PGAAGPRAPPRAGASPGERGVSRPLLVEAPGRPTRPLVLAPDVVFGGDLPVVIGGPCAVESEEQVLRLARAVAAAGGRVFRGGAFKPRSSPYSFQGLGRRGLELLRVVKAET